MLIKPDKPPSQTTSYRPISLLSVIMKLFEWVTEKRFRKILKTTVSLACISQVLGSPSEQMTTFSVSLRPSWQASIRMCKQSEHSVKSASKKSHTAEHCWKYNHDFDWKHKKVLDFEKNWKTRTIKESVYSEENEHHINGISFKLPNIWKPIL